MSLSFDELKEKGNDSVRQKKYRDAVRYYTAALEINPRSHIAYSNRSLAHCKLGLFKDALTDANRCTELDPSFARGYLRKSVALTHLDKTKEAMKAAERGYQLRGSATICRDCVTQWLEANRLFHKEMVDEHLGQSGPPEEVIPKGCRIISEDYMTVLVNVIVSRMQPTTKGVKLEFMLAWLLTLLEELKRTLQLFGHTLGACAREWVESLSLVSRVDPSTTRVPTDVVELVLARASAFATWFDTSVDHNLYPIAQPIMSLIVVVVGVRCISLNLINIEHPVTVLSCQACLPFFERAPLTTAVYTQQRLCLYKELLEAFSSFTYTYNAVERQLGEKVIKSVESILKQQQVDEFLTRICEKSITIARLRLRSTPGYDPVQYALECGKALSQIRKKPPKNLKSHVLQKMDVLKNVHVPFEVSQDIPLDMMEAKMMALYESMLDLASSAGALVGSGGGEHVLAAEALQVAETSFLKYFHLQIAKGAFGLDEAGMPFAMPRSAILQGAASFLGINDRFTADYIIRWKCISSEFRAILIRLGIGKQYIKTFQAIQTALVEGQVSQESVMTITKQHKAEAQQFMKNKGKWVLSCLFRQAVREIESILQPEQLVLEYSVLHTDISDALDDPNCVLVALQAKSEVTVFSIDFKGMLLILQKWVKALADPKAQNEAQSLAESICKVLVPPPIEALLNAAPKKQVFLCPDVPLNVLPLELLLFTDGETLGEKCTITYLSSSRELLRNLVIERVSHEVDGGSLDLKTADGTGKKSEPTITNAYPATGLSDTPDPANPTVPATIGISDPADTTDPANPTVPATIGISDPADTTDPANPATTGISDPADTTDPANPATTGINDPADFTDPANSATTGISDPADTTDPANPATTGISDPADTSDPANPTVPAIIGITDLVDTPDPANPATTGISDPAATGISDLADTTDSANAIVPTSTTITDLVDTTDSANATLPANSTYLADTTDLANFANTSNTIDPAKVTNLPDITDQTDATITNQSSNSSICVSTLGRDNVSKTNECVIVAAPNFDLEKSTAVATETGLWGAVIQAFASLFNEPAESDNVIPPLIGAESEATEVENTLSKLAMNLIIRPLKNNNATLLAVLSLQSPLILHFSTHGFSNQEYQGYRSSFWNDTKSGLLLAGVNTFRQGKLEKVAIEAGTGELTAMAACGMSLEGTRLVYLSTCVSSFGMYSFNESLNSLAEAFRSAGAQTVIATLWQVYDDTAEHFSTYFYEALGTTDTTPSQALTVAKQKLREKTSYKHWSYWSSFICIGENNPVFPRV